jgi:hypothetical protein
MATHSCHHDVLPHSRDKNKKPRHYGLNPLKQQAKINSSFLKWLMSGFVTVTGKVTKESSYFKSKFFYHFLSLLL